MDGISSFLGDMYFDKSLSHYMTKTAALRSSYFSFSRTQLYCKGLPLKILLRSMGFYMNGTTIKNMTSSFPMDIVLSNSTSAVSTISNSAGTFYQLLVTYQTYEVAKKINNYKFYVLMVLACIGNGLSIYAVRHRTKTSSSCFYIVNLAVGDSLLIFCKGGFYLVSLYNIDLGHWGCKIVIYMMNALLFSSVWLVVLMTGERVVAITWPLKAMAWLSVKRAKLMVVAIYVTTAAFNSAYLVVTTSMYQGGFAICSVLGDQTGFFNKIWLPLEVSIVTYIPQILIFLLNVSMILKIKEARRKQAELRVESQENSGQVTAMLLTVSIAFFLLTSPYALFLILVKQGIWDYMATPYSYSVYLLINTILRLLADLNHCVNFLLYVASGRSFRKEIGKLCLCSRKHNAFNSQLQDGTPLSVISATRFYEEQVN